MSLAELRKELRELRKEHVKPASRMRKSDISAEIEKLRGARETTAAPAATPSAPEKVSRSAVESIKKAKAAEFPVKPGPAPKALAKKPSAADKMKSKKDIMRAMLAAMADSSDEEC
jgi:hypothetical protein